MPARMDLGRNLVARPDRVDFRDRPYQPPLRSLPEQYPPSHLIKDNLQAYVNDKLILDQGEEGACTGFGLAAVINYIYWSRWRLALRQFAAAKDEGKAPKASLTPPRPPIVSAHMLFRNARIHDEWEGEGYDWSSCRGAMKGWHKHGVCEWDVWPSPKKRPAEDWSYDAALRPLGAYYRVNAKSVADMQAAIFEVNAVFCASDVHAGWSRPSLKTSVDGKALAVIQPGGRESGGHAFALVGYTRDGFIVQNSWGRDWGSNGFALLTYEDWIKHGYDAWVAALGAPMNIGLRSAAAGAGMSGSMMTSAFASLQPPAGKANVIAVPAWTESRAYEHAVVLGNDGVLIDRLPEAQTPGEALTIVAEEKIAELDCGSVAVYIHGGLNDEEAAIARACRLGPWFLENGIHPIFVVWRTGILEALGQIAQDDVKKFEEQIRSIRTRGIGDIVDAAIERARDAFDLGFEAAAEKFIGKPVWTQMKQNAEMASRRGSGLDLLARALAKCGKPVHLLGHSAGSIMIGHLFGAAKRAGLGFASCGLYAPACTLEFAIDHYGPALAKGGALAKAPLHIDVLTDEAETKDSVGPYGKSLLYLVSRALEEQRKIPLLGLDIALKQSGKGKKMEFDAQHHDKLFQRWSAIVQSSGLVSIKRHHGPDVRASETKQISIAHGSFDNDCDVVEASLRRVLGKSPKVKVTDLTGF
ncbi:MAG: C1 family peptidase [Rhizobiales bacterium]|nr:C1 family peptidase [Hyphomicrobiales bacterium]